MKMHIVIKGKEVTHPLAKLGMGFSAFLLVIIMVPVLVFFVLPLVGIVLAISMGIFLAIIIGILILMLALILLLRRYKIRGRLLENEDH